MKTELKYGLVIGLLMFLWLILEFVMGFHTDKIRYQPYVTNLAYLIPVIGIYQGIKSKRIMDLDGYITYAEGLKIGFIISIYVAIVAVITQFLFHTFINLDYFDKMIEYSTQMKADSGMTEEEALTTAKAIFNLTSYLFQAFIFNLAIGSVVALIAATMLKRKSE